MSGHDLNVHLLLNLVRANPTCFRCSGCLNAKVRIRPMKIAHVISTKSHEFAHLFNSSIFTKNIDDNSTKQYEPGRLWLNDTEHNNSSIM